MIDAIPTAAPQPAPAHKPGEITADDFGFDDLIDAINPLQHLPVIGTLYRELTGDEMAAPASLAGGALYGGLFGFFGALGNEFLRAVTGRDVGETVLAMLQGDGEENAAAAVANDPYRAARAYRSAQTLL